MLSPFLVSPLKPPPPPLLPSSPTHSLPLPGPGIPLFRGIEPSQDQGPFLPLMPNKAIVCYICSWSHESHHVFSLVGGLVPGSSGGLVTSCCCSAYGATNPFSSLGTFSNSFIGDPVLCPMDGCDHALLYLSGTVRASQETAISESHQQALLGIHNSVWV
jgi:hypothetical protein